MVSKAKFTWLVYPPKITKEEADRIKEKYQGWQVFDSRNAYGDCMERDIEFDFQVLVCEEWHYIEILGIDNFNEYFD